MMQASFEQLGRVLVRTGNLVRLLESLLLLVRVQAGGL